MINILWRITIKVVVITFSSYFVSAQELALEPLDLEFDQPIDIVSTYVDNDARLFVAEKTGKIFIIDDPESETPIKLSEPFLDISDKVNTSGEGGLLGLAFSPEYDLKGYFFVNYTFDDPENGLKFSTRISRFNVSDDPNIADLSSELVVLTVEQEEDNHNGGDLVFGPDDMLYIPLGDGGGANDEYENAQNPQSMLGKVLRIDVKTLPYNIPLGNPFKNDLNVLDEIWSIGWRNPWRASFDRETGEFWAGDVGQGQFEEVNFEPANSQGAYNFGWNCYEGSIVFEPLACIYPIDHVEPVYEYSQNLGTKSVTGGYVYRGTQHPDLIGKYIFTDFVKSSVFWIISKDGEDFNTERIELSQNPIPEKVSTFGEAENGELYFATFENGEIWKLMSTVTNNIRQEEINVTLYPNPGTNELILETNENVNLVELYSLTGQKVKSFNSLISNTIDISDMTSGVYFVSIHIGQMQVKKKIVVQ